MRSWAHKVECVVDRLILPALVALLAIIGIEIFVPSLAEEHHTIIQWADWAVLAVFASDVFFKFRRAKNIPHFLRTSWLDIIAIFPFFLVFRLFEGILGLIGISETMARSQQVLHAGLEAEKEAELALKEGSRFAKEINLTARAEGLTRFLNPIARSTRLFIFGDPHMRKDVKDQVKRIEKEGRVAKREIIKEERLIKAAVFYEKPGLAHKYITASGRIDQKAVGQGRRAKHFY